MSDNELNDSNGSNLGYALCKCWKDNPNAVVVAENDPSAGTGEAR